MDEQLRRFDILLNRLESWTVPKTPLGRWFAERIFWFLLVLLIAWSIILGCFLLNYHRIQERRPKYDTRTTVPYIYWQETDSVFRVYRKLLCGNLPEEDIRLSLGRPMESN